MPIELNYLSYNNSLHGFTNDTTKWKQQTAFSPKTAKQRALAEDVLRHDFDDDDVKCFTYIEIGANSATESLIYYKAENLSVYAIIIDIDGNLSSWSVVHMV